MAEMIRRIRTGARFVVFEIRDGGKYNTKGRYRYEAIPQGNGLIPRPETTKGETDRVVNFVSGLYPDMDYLMTVASEDGTFSASVTFHTETESVTLDIRRFGAVGDGEHDDTISIQAAINACPRRGRVLIPEGRYAVTALFLKSHTDLDIEEGAVLIGTKDKSRLPVLPGTVTSYDEETEYNYASWEGNPLPQYASMITGIEVENCNIYGRGTLDGNAGFEDWWKIRKDFFDVARPNMFYVNHSHDIFLAGLTIQNSPCWTLHPYYSERVDIMDVTINNPWNSPNTDGLDPESCTGMQVLGVHFSLGDDCIAIKSGKIYMGRKYKRPSSDIRIAHCLMESGHGAVTVGSEIAGGVNRVKVEDCLFHNTDRGLRIKTRRGRGKDSILDDIVFENIYMDHVMAPFVVNSFYFCDPDGKSDYVQSRREFPVDDRTPSIGRLIFRNIEAVDTEWAAGYYLGLPEKPVGEIRMEHVRVSYKQDATPGRPAMSNGVPDTCKAGIYAENVQNLILTDVIIEGQEGEQIVRKGAGAE